MIISHYCSHHHLFSNTRTHTHTFTTVIEIVEIVFLGSDFSIKTTINEKNNKSHAVKIAHNDHNDDDDDDGDGHYHRIVRGNETN